MRILQNVPQNHLHYNIRNIITKYNTIRLIQLNR